MSIIFFEILLTGITNKYFTVLPYATLYDAGKSAMTIFSGQHFIKSIHNKNIISFYLDEDHELNKKKLIVIQSDALRLKFTCDTSSIIAVHLSDEIYYGEFIHLLNVMEQDGHKRYAEWDGTFYILAEEPPGKIAPMGAY